MHCTRFIAPDILYVGGSDRRLALFESAHPIPRGMSYNSYLLLDDKTVLFDAVDRSVAPVFFENLAFGLAGRPLDYVVVTHMEPDHAATLGELVLRYPAVKIVCNDKSLAMIRRFFTFDAEGRAVLMKEGDALETAHHRFVFYMAPMVHWPEVMVAFDEKTGTLFSADAFGTFGALSGNLFADEVRFERDWLADSRRYYANIVGKYGPQVQALLKKAEALDIRLLCPLHGPVWRGNIGWYVDKYRLWAACEPEETAVLIAFASVYGHTENAVDILARDLAERGIRNIALLDTSYTHASYIVAEAFRCSHIVFAAPTYNAGVFISMENLLLDLAAHNFQNRTVAVIENGTWAPTAGKSMREKLALLKRMTILEQTVSIPSAPNADTASALAALADEIARSMGNNA